MRVLDLHSLTLGIGALALGEKDHRTQIATAMLATKYSAPEGVAAGATLGTMIAGVPALLLGDLLLRSVPLPLLHLTSAAVCASIGIAVFLR